MKDKIREFLANAGGQASTLAIARQVLHLTHATPVTAERVLSALLQNDPAFASDGVGNWHLLQTNAGAGVGPTAKVFLVGTPMRAQEILRAQRMILGWTAFAEAAETPLQVAEITFASNSPSGEEIYPRISRAEFVARFAMLFTDSILVSWQPHAVTQAWRRIFAEPDALWFPPATISLSVLARNLLGSNRTPALPGLYRQLCGVQNWRESFSDILQAQVEILRALLVKCRAQGLADWRHIAAFARRPRRADFASYAFDEKYVDTLPERPGVYIMRNAAAHVLYVGKAANLRERVRSYFQSPQAADRKLQQLRSQMFTLDFKIVDTELDALLLEHRLIHRLNPEANRQRKISTAPFPHGQRLPGIFLAPVHPSASTATKGRVIVYLLSSRSLQRFSVRLGRKPGKRLHRALRDFWAETVSSDHTGERLAKDQSDRLEIAARWFQQNAACLNVLDPAEGASLQELESRLQALLRTPEILTAKFRFAATETSAAGAAA